jgi:hypothetical protein
LTGQRLAQFVQLEKGSRIMALSKANLSLLGTIVAAMAVSETPYAMLTEKQIAGLSKEGLVETNGEIRDGDKIAVRATEKGIALNNEQNNNDGGAAATGDAGGAAAPVSMPSNFVTGSGFVPSVSRGGRGRSLYDFDSLAIGGFIFVPATDAKPNPAKSLASTVSSATKRSKPKVFRVQSVKGGTAYGEFTPPSDGAVIYRAADATPTA